MAISPETRPPGEDGAIGLQPDCLNLGCGTFKKEGFLNIDFGPQFDPDLIVDLNHFPYPFADERFRLIEADHVLEHLDDPFAVMKELHRILAPGGRLVVRVPHFSRGFCHADHRRGFDSSFPSYFNPAFTAGFCGAAFDLERLRLVWFAQPYLKKITISPSMYYGGLVAGRTIEFFANLSVPMCNRVWCFLVGGFEEMEMRFIRRP